MSFADTFATQLGDRTGTTVDASQFPDSDTVSTDLQALQDFLNGLGDTDRSTLDIIASDGIDLSQAIDDSGATVIPGGSLLALAGTVGEPLGNLVTQAQQAFEVAMEDPGGSQGQVASAVGGTTGSGTGDASGAGNGTTHQGDGNG
jgi:hypothetical protein